MGRKKKVLHRHKKEVQSYIEKESKKYPIRCRIIDPDGEEIIPGYSAIAPDDSKPHIGKEGIAEWDDFIVKITLDDGTVLYGYECWWEPIEEKEE